MGDSIEERLERVEKQLGMKDKGDDKSKDKSKTEEKKDLNEMLNERTFGKKD